jgi:hypothetical protein
MKVGFEIYKLRKFSCLKFELSFYLFNDAGLAMARLLSCGKLVFPWVEVGKKLSFADLIKQPAKSSSGINPAAVLTGANSIPGCQTIFGNQGKQAPSNHTSIFYRIIFPRTSTFNHLS